MRTSWGPWARRCTAFQNWCRRVGAWTNPASCSCASSHWLSASRRPALREALTRRKVSHQSRERSRRWSSSSGRRILRILELSCSLLGMTFSSETSNHYNMSYNIACRGAYDLAKPRLGPVHSRSSSVPTDGKDVLARFVILEVVAAGHNGADRGNVDNAPPAGLAHRRNGGFGTEDIAQEVDAQDGVPT